MKVFYVRSGTEPDNFRLVGIQLQSSRRAPVLDRGNILFHFPTIGLDSFKTHVVLYLRIIGIEVMVDHKGLNCLYDVFSIRNEFFGLMTEPCETLHVRLTGSDILDSTQNDWVQLDRYDLNQLSARS